MFQKLLIGVMCLCLFVIGFVVYSFYAPVTVAGNKSYEDEYYYNDINNRVPDMSGQEPLYDTLKNDVPYDINLGTEIINEYENLPGFNFNIPDELAKTKEEDMTNSYSYRVLINKDYPLPAEYAPNDLVVPDILFSQSSYTDKKLMRKKAAKALEKMFAVSEAEGLSVTAISGYRSYERQQKIYEQNLNTAGAEHTGMNSARPGYSEHQSGLSLDVSAPSADLRLEEDFGDTPEGIWLKNNCWKYGYIIRYPEGKSDITGYAYEPWHIRFVGKKLAAYLHNNNITLEEYYGYEPSDATVNSDGYGNSIDVEDASYYTDEDKPKEE